MSLNEALSRTLLLMRTDLDASVPDGALVDALTSVRVVLHAGADAMATHSGQTALVTAALTMARSGHEVWIDGADVDTIGAQPPLEPGSLIDAIVAVGQDLLPGCSIARGAPPNTDLAVTIGTVATSIGSTRRIAIDAGDWWGRIAPQSAGWSGLDWPLGGICAGVLVASEAFRIAMRRLANHARARDYFDELYAETADATFALAPENTPKTISLPHFDLVSGGAIANAALFALARLPGVVGSGRVLDDDVSALSNLNRNALLVRSALEIAKVTDLARRAKGIAIDPEPVRYVMGMPVAPIVLVGVDDIPSRWAVQAAAPYWLGVGATEGFAVLVSSHTPGQACVGCLHPAAASPTGPIPTAAFVSLLSGLLLVARWLRSLGLEGPALADQQAFINALRPEGWTYGAMPIAPNSNCPVGCAASTTRTAA